MVYDHMFSQNLKLERYELPLDLIKSCSKTYSRYTEALKSRAAMKKQEQVSRKPKLAIVEVKQRKANIEECISRLGRE